MQHTQFKFKQINETNIHHVLTLMMSVFKKRVRVDSISPNLLSNAVGTFTFALANKNSRPMILKEEWKPAYEMHWIDSF